MNKFKYFFFKAWIKFFLLYFSFIVKNFQSNLIKNHNKIYLFRKMSDQENEEDTLQINTSNQIEQDRKLAKKKKFLADKKKDQQSNKVIKKPKSDGSIDKNSKFNKASEKLLKNIKIIKTIIFIFFLFI